VTAAGAERRPTAGGEYSAPAAGGRAYLSIGEVLTQLRGDFPEVTISKIRFLEAEGLVEPDRTASGYRKFSRADVARLRYVLGAQRDRYLPLRVIKDQLEAIDRGLEPAQPGDDSGPRVPRALTAVDDTPGPDSFLSEATELRLSRAELLSASGLDESQLVAVEQYGLVVPRPGGHYDGSALTVAQTVAAMAAFGIEPRHLRPFKTAADREIGLVEQVVSPMARGRTPEARARAEESVRELASLSVRLHAALVRAGLHA
jgi:DNA-binding transcriptional MerR regulator